MITIVEIQTRLATAIKESGITQSEIARRLGVKHPQISCYVHGKKMPALDTLANLCKIIDVSPAYILCFEEEDGSRAHSELFEYSDGTHSVRHKLG